MPNTMLYCDPRSRDRSKFGCHVFLSWNDLIYDACAGPEAGQKHIKQYMNGIDVDEASKTHRDGAIDSHIPSEIWDSTKKQYVPVRSNEVTGTDENVKYFDQSYVKNGFMGELDILMNLGSMEFVKENLQEEEAVRSLDLKGLAVSLKTSNDKEFQIRHVSSPELRPVEGKDDTEAARLGEIDTVMTVIASNTSYDVTVEWRVYESTSRAGKEAIWFLDGGVSDGGSGIDADAREAFAKGRSIPVIVDEKNCAAALMGRNTIHCLSSMPIDSLVELTQRIVDHAPHLAESAMDVSSSKGENVMPLEGTKILKFNVSCGTCHFALTTANGLKTRHVAELDWTYDNEVRSINTIPAVRPLKSLKGRLPTKLDQNRR